MASFLGLPSELRNMIYKELLVLDSPIDYMFGLSLSTAILYTNRLINRESSWILYAENCFDFAGLDHARVSSFLDQIGRTNAGHIRDIRIRFPRICDIRNNDLELEEDSVLLIARIVTDCIDLRTITIDIMSANDMELELAAVDSPNITTKALSLINTHLLQFPRIQRIAVEVYDDGRNSY